MTDDATIRPFRIDIQQIDLDDLSDRLARTRWPSESPEPGWSRGVPLDYLRELARYWATGFDWRTQEAELNQFHQFVTTIAGQDIHFLHVRSPEPAARALLLIHGWPSSPFEFRKVIGPLTDPRAHGLDPAAAFHVVIPSLPGYGFSTPVTAPGAGNLFGVAQQFAELMNRLGYQQFAVQATDVGSGVAGMLPIVASNRVIGTHLTGTVAAMPFGPAVDVDGLSDADRTRAERFNHFQADGLGYLQLQSTRPQTLAYALTDSPVGQAAWIYEKFGEWTESNHDPESVLTREEILNNISLYWLTSTATSSARLYAESFYTDFSTQKLDFPVAVSVFPGELYRPLKLWAERIYPQLFYWNEVAKGGHFAAFEQPGIFVGELRQAFRKFR